MKTTRVFNDTIAANNAGFDIIANEGGTRSSKTFSELQLFKIITDNSKRQRIITIVSHSLPHLEGGAIRDFDNILTESNIQPDNVRTKHPYVYKLKKSIVEFVGFDRPGKALGAARDILLINEANKMPFSICHQLMTRTTEAVFMDWNPSEEFWFDEQGYRERKGCKVIHSNFYDNIQNLSERQLNELKEARRKAYEEDKRGQRGYWWNYWQVYGLGKKGMLEGVIFPYWQEYQTLPDDAEFFVLFVVDWGGSDPTTLTELNIDGDNNRLYVKEHIYQPQILNSKLIDYIQSYVPRGVPVICDSARKDKIFELQMAGINALGATKGEGSIIDGIERMQEFVIFVHEDSKNAQFEFRNYKRVKDERTGEFIEMPEDKHNHCIDAIRYGVRFYRRNVRPLSR
jgi:phage terminase large subunit